MSSLLKSKWLILIGFIIVYCGICNKKNTEPIKKMPGWLVHIVFPFSSGYPFTARYVNIFACYTGLSWMIISIAGYIQIFLRGDYVEYINTWWILNGLGIETMDVLMLLLSNTYKSKAIKVIISILRCILCAISVIIILTFNILWGICIVKK